MKCEICWKKSEHAEFITDGWVNVCAWCCKCDWYKKTKNSTQVLTIDGVVILESTKIDISEKA